MENRKLTLIIQLRETDTGNNVSEVSAGSWDTVSRIDITYIDNRPSATISKSSYEHPPMPEENERYMPVLFGMRSEKMALVSKWGHLGIPDKVPFGILSEAWAMRNHSQTLARLSERGGLSLKEMCAVIKGCRYDMITDQVENQIRYINKQIEIYNSTKTINSSVLKIEHGG